MENGEWNMMQKMCKFTIIALLCLFLSIPSVMALDPQISYNLMTSNSTNGYTANRSSVFQPLDVGEAFRAFDGNLSYLTGALWEGRYPNKPVNDWVGQYIPTYKAATAYTIYPYVNPAYRPKDFTFEGSNSGFSSGWVVLDNRTNQNTWTYGVGNQYNITNTVPYYYYRLNITASCSVGDQAVIPEVYIYGIDVPAPISNFAVNKDNGMVWSSFQFNDTSLYAPSMWNYSFLLGSTKTWYNGTTGSDRNLTWMPSTGGNYTVQLWAQNVNGGNYSSKVQYLDVWNWSPASFTGTPLSGANPLSVTFSGSSNNATDYYWQFGDLSTDTVQNPTHIYTADGIYNVNYRTKNSHHSGNWSNRSGYITVNISLTSDFAGVPTVGFSPLTVNFVDMSTGDGLYYWEWDFGDAGTSLLRNPSHTYTTSGAFSVKLTVKGSDGTAVTTKTGYVNVLYPFSKYTNPLGYILANGVDNKIHFYDFKNATDGEYIEIIVSGSYEVP